MAEKSDQTVMGTLTLKISNISTFMTKIDQRIQSPRQQVAGLRWFIYAYPTMVDNVTYLSCFLAGASAFKWSASVDATFRIVKKNGGGFGNETSFSKKLMGKKPLDEGFGYRTFAKSEALLSATNDFVVSDSVEIRVDIIVTDVCGAAFNVFETV
ncbi:hypothetical protein AAVH_43741, partial [Aphelenchoides avenae]